jgi:hypothetical protein
MSETHVRLYNPDTGGVWDCPVDAVEGYLRRGWVKSDKPLADEGEEEAPEPAAEEAEFDPSEHTVAEVQDYLEANPDDADRVLDAERAGKKRVGVADAVAEARADDDE